MTAGLSWMELTAVAAATVFAAVLAWLLVRPYRGLAGRLRPYVAVARTRLARSVDVGRSGCDRSRVRTGDLPAVVRPHRRRESSRGSPGSSPSAPRRNWRPSCDRPGSTPGSPPVTGFVNIGCGRSSSPPVSRCSAGSSVSPYAGWRRCCCSAQRDSSSACSSRAAGSTVPSDGAGSGSAPSYIR